eukprot:9319987-Pyramimonas_sp.AAC.1
MRLSVSVYSEVGPSVNTLLTILLNSARHLILTSSGNSLDWFSLIDVIKETVKPSSAGAQLSMDDPS